MTSLCTVCGTLIHWQPCPTGGWWIHDDHPLDNHDAESQTDPEGFE